MTALHAALAAGNAAHTEHRAGARTRNGDALPRYLVERLLLDTTGYLQGALAADRVSGHERAGESGATLKSARDRLAAAGIGVPAIEAQARYGWVARVTEGVVERPDSSALRRAATVSTEF